MRREIMDKKAKLKIIAISFLTFLVLALVFFGLGVLLFSISENAQTENTQNLLTIVWDIKIITDAVIEGLVLSSTFTTLVIFYLIGKEWKKELDL